MSGICSVHPPKTTDPDCAACNAVTDTGPTPERHEHAWIARGSRKTRTCECGEKQMQSLADLRWYDYLEANRLATTLETLRGERDQWRSRYIVMARLNHRARHIENGPLAMEDCYYAECAEVRALAGAETEALYDDEHAASCDVNTSPHDYGWEKVTTCTCGGADGGERRGG